MAELDVESALRVDLKKCRSAYEQLERASLSLVEDRDRLRVAGQAWIEADEAFWRSPNTGGAAERRKRAREVFRAALEGRDG